MKKRVAVLGVTGSIGGSTLDVLRAGPDYFEPVLFSSHSRRDALLALGVEFPGVLLALSGLDSGPEPISYYGEGGLARAIIESGADIVVNGIAGAAGLQPSLTVLESGADLALANKESLVMAGPLLFALAARKGRRILPVDSEHAAIFSLLEAHGKEGLEEILLTASGGPFRTYPMEELRQVRAAAALAHPTWSMGAKISIDSASLANKGLEVIEAVRLFDVPPEQVRVLIHPQSIIHSMIRLGDGAVYAQLSKPDMRLPIQSALRYPERGTVPLDSLSFDSLTLSFEAPDTDRFPMLSLAYEVIRRDGIYPVIYNAANEAAVAAFLAEGCTFLDIPRIVEYVLNKTWHQSAAVLESIWEADAAARKAASRCIAERQEG